LEAVVQVPVGGSLEEAQVQAVRELGCLEEAAVQVPVGVSSGALVQAARAAGCLEGAVVQVPVGDSLEEAQVQAEREAAAVQVSVGVSSGEEVLRSGVVVRAVVWVQAACLGAVRESAAREARLFLVRFMCMLTCIACERRVYVRARRKQGQPRTRDSLSPCR
jgi:hypothetical protein